MQQDKCGRDTVALVAKLGRTRCAGSMVRALAICLVFIVSGAPAQTTPNASQDFERQSDDSSRRPEKPRKSDDTVHDAKKLLKKHPESDSNGDGRLSEEEARQFLSLHPQALREKKLQKHPKLDRDHDGRLSDEELKFARDKYEAKQSARGLKHTPDAGEAGERPLIEGESAPLKSKDARRKAKGSSRPAGSSVEAGVLEKKAAKQARKDAKRAKSVSAKGDPWVHFVEKFSDRYQFDAAQRASAQSILREFLERRAALPVQDPAPIDGGKKKAKASTEHVESDQGRLFIELKQKLESLPTASQRAATRPAGEPVSPSQP